MSHNIDRKKVARAVYNALQNENNVINGKDVKVSEIVTTVRIGEKNTITTKRYGVSIGCFFMFSKFEWCCKQNFKKYFIAEVGWENYR